MRTVTISVASEEEFTQQVLSTAKSKSSQDRISFVSEALLWKMLSPKRLEIIKVMTGAGPLSIREVARRVERDVKAVHSEVHQMLDNSLLQLTPDGKVEFPYDVVHVDFVIKKAA